jgi:prepilin-type N-terminal cleavage/methylation domain-containing protein
MHAQVTPRAFTLIEVLVVIAIVLILLAVSIEGFRTFAVGAGGDASARRVLKTLEEAHARTLSSDGDTQYGVHFETDSATLFVGSAYVSGAGGNEVSTLHRAEISAVSLTGGVDDVVFSRIRGIPSATGTVTITQTGDASIERTIYIYETGLSDMEP